jgi:hypothetical protein
MQRHWFVALALSGCAVDATYDDLDREATTTRTEVARVIAADGAVWRFLEADPGSLFVWATSAGRDGRLAVPSRPEGSSYIELYRALTTAPTPRALLDAQARADVVEPEPPVDQSGEQEETSEPPKPIAQISASDFAAWYCPNFLDYLYCWPSFYGNPFVKKSMNSMSGYIGAVDTTRFRFRYKKHSYSDWTTLVDVQALPGEIHYVTQSYWSYDRWRILEVRDHGNNLVRYSNVGLD